MKKEEVRSLVAGDGAMHRRIGTVNHPVSELAGTAFQLIPRCTRWTAEIDCLRARRKRIYSRRVASWAIDVCFAPWLSGNTCALRTALIPFQIGCREM